MIPKEAQARYVKLKDTINHYRVLYHVYDKEEISQAALDSLKHELTELEEKYPAIITPDVLRRYGIKCRSGLSTTLSHRKRPENLMRE
jgi:NAD-dependent DNA ligase